MGEPELRREDSPGGMLRSSELPTVHSLRVTSVFDVISDKDLLFMLVPSVDPLRASFHPDVRALMAALPAGDFSSIRIRPGSSGWAICVGARLDERPTSRPAWERMFDRAVQGLARRLQENELPKRVVVLAPSSGGIRELVPPAAWSSRMARLLAPFELPLLVIRLEDSMNPVEPVGEKHWWAAVAPEEVSAELAGISSSIRENDAVPFCAGLFRSQDLMEVVRRRAPLVDATLPLSYPLSWEEVKGLCEWDADPVPEVAPGFSRAKLEDVQKAIACGALRVCDRDDIDAISPMFSVVQGSKSRLIFDLRRVNQGVDVFDFSLQGVTSIPILAAGAQFAAKIDLASAYWQIPLEESLARKMGTWITGGRFARWEVLPFGLAVAPFAFAAITHLLIKAWRARGIRCLAYLDDVIVFSASFQEHVMAVRTVVEDLNAAGLRISAAKAFLAPFRRLDVLGVTVDLALQAFWVAPGYVTKVEADLQEVLAHRSVPIPRKCLESLVGRLGFVGLVHPALNVKRSAMIFALGGSSDDGAAPVAWSQPLLDELMWWTSEEATAWMRRPAFWDSLPVTKLYAKHLAPVRPVLSLSSDASEFGIGLTVDGGLVAEPLPASLVGGSSAARELYAILRCLQWARASKTLGRVSWFRPLPCIRIATDSQAALGPLGGASTTLGCAQLAWAIVQEAWLAGVRVSFDWVPREYLSSVDAASRISENDRSRAMMPTKVMEWLAGLAWEAERPDVDLFADAVAHLVPRWCAFGQVPGSEGDGLDTPLWRSDLRLWAFPPFALVRQVVKRLVTFRPRVVAILPDDDELVRAALGEWSRVPLGRVSLLWPPRFTFSAPAPRLLAAFFLPRR